MIDLHLDVADPTIYGWKAHYLSRVVKAGLTVPHAIALAPDDPIDLLDLNEAVSYAVRSSGLSEDSSAQSYAGYFRTHLEVRSTEKLREAIIDVRASADAEMPMAVVVQEMVESPSISGVAFSINPITFETANAAVSWVHGLGDRLVGGAVAGNDVQVDMKSGSVVAGDWPHSSTLLQQLIDGVSQLADLLGQPVDVEWAASNTGALVILQLRPIVLPCSKVVDLSTSAAIASLPGFIRSHTKLELRSIAAKVDVPMSRARAVLTNSQAGVPTIEPFVASNQSAGRSVVLLHPAHLDGKVLREFTRDCGTDVEFFVRGCQRYAIRQYPEQSGALQAVADSLQRGLKYAAVSCVIEQEIFHAYATGILRRTSDGYLVEAALGHFVPKGYVETSTFVLSGDLELVTQVLTTQTKAYHFINGHVVMETPPYEELTLLESDLALLIKTLQPILIEQPGAAVEFGLLGHPGDLTAYLIDVANSDSEETGPTTTDIRRGVISSGIAIGRIIDLRDEATSDDLNAHLYDTMGTGEDAALTPAIYIAKAASVDLLPVVRAAHPDSGFLFERASILAHLPVVLRERGLAAVTLPVEQIDDLVARGLSVRIDTGDAVHVAPVENGVSI
ncbi:hypothetical protein HBA53_24565 (plasmid) [Rhodococcus pyridinivorans]|uniref:PEP/pyruvate-binding domain-containing protein n=1 Tax=Rhodococcus pyridinivorans TaxID=103816 RepID=UPI001C30CDB2|nr:PEP/pyruvate-binding domain-containing protein [Rhodococcus pyridinivorans]QXF84286.1 hypothetical protein HBA53_24565 [Rhodococcus pyridinivorans]